MQISFYILLSLLIGAMLSIYLPMNSAVSRYLGSPITANITFFFVALIVVGFFLRKYANITRQWRRTGHIAELRNEIIPWAMQTMWEEQVLANHKDNYE